MATGSSLLTVFLEGRMFAMIKLLGITGYFLGGRSNAYCLGGVKPRWKNKIRQIRQIFLENSEVDKHFRNN